MILTFYKTYDNFVLADKEAQVQRTRDFLKCYAKLTSWLQEGKNVYLGWRTEYKSRKKPFKG